MTNDIRCHDDPPAVILKEDSLNLSAANKDRNKIRKLGIYIIRFGCKIAKIDFLE